VTRFPLVLSFALTIGTVSTAFATTLPIGATPQSSGSNHLIQIADGNSICDARLFGKKARLWFEGGKPVRYQWSNRAALSAEMRGDTIYIAASPTATLSNVQMGKDANGRTVITGNWKFQNNKQNGVVFTCNPA
jgi:hypothetical protein